MTLRAAHAKRSTNEGFTWLLSHMEQRRHVAPDIGLLHHSDQGCSYASEDYQHLLAAHGMIAISSTLMVRRTFLGFAVLVLVAGVLEVNLSSKNLLRLELRVS